MTDTKGSSIEDEVPFDGGTALLEDFLESSRGGSSEEPGNCSKSDLMMDVLAEYTEAGRLNEYSLMLRPRIDLLCMKFTNKIRRDRTKHLLDDMLRVNIDPGKVLNKEDLQKKTIDSLDDYIASLNIDEGDLDTNDHTSDHTLDYALGTYWKLENNTSLQSAEWEISENVVGRRFYEGDSDEEEGENEALAANLPEILQTRRKSCTNRDTLLKLGLWDVVFDEGQIPEIQKREKQDKPWISNKRELETELRTLGIRKADLKLNDCEKPLFLDVVNNAVDRLTAKYMDTGSYLRPHDMLFCQERTKFSEDQVVAWFKRFRDECPNGRLSRLHLITLFGKIFPEGKNILLRILYEFVEGNATKITSHIFRIFDSDGNDYLDFKEYLMAIDIANRDTDNNGEIDLEEMANIIDTLDCIEGVQAGVVRYDENGHPVDTPTALQRAQDLFLALDKPRTEQAALSLEEFLDAATRMTEIMKRQDAQEQKKKLNCLIFKSPMIQKHNDFSKDGMTELCIKLITKVGVNIVQSQIAHVELKYLSGNEIFTKSIFVRFSELELRKKIWERKKQAAVGKVFMEEWLTDGRTKLMKKCKRLLADRIIEDVRTDEGDIIVLFQHKESNTLTSKVITSQEEYSELLVTLNMKAEEPNKLDPEQLLLEKPEQEN